MRSIAMQLGGDVVPRAMREPLAEACIADHIARGIVRLPSSNGAVLCIGVLYRGNRGIASVAHGRKDELFPLTRLTAHHASPGNVVPDGLRPAGKLGPDVDQHEVAAADRTRTLPRRLIVRVGGVWSGAAVGPLV